MQAPAKAGSNIFRTLDNGLKIVVIEDRVQPAVILRVLLPRGENDDPPGRAGAADISAGLMLKGAGNRDASELAELVDGMGASLVGESSAEYSVFGIDALAEHTDTAFEIVRDIVFSPRLDRREFGLIKDQMIAGIKAQRSSPGYLASINLAPAVYGPRAPQGMITTEKSVGAVSMDDVQTFRRISLSGNGAIVLCIGDVNASAVAAAIEKQYSQLKTGATPVFLTAIPPSRSPGGVIEVDKADLTQTTVQIGKPGPGRLDTDYFSAQVANYVLGGGGFISRLMAAVRSKGGKTYGIRSAVSSGATPDLFYVKFTTRNEEVISSVNLTLDVWNRFIADGPTDTEVSEAKEFFKGYFFLQTETPGQRAAKMLAYIYYGLGIEEIDRYPERVDAVTTQSALEAAKKYMSADGLTFCMVGPKTVTSAARADIRRRFPER